LINLSKLSNNVIRQHTLGLKKLIGTHRLYFRWT